MKESTTMRSVLVGLLFLILVQFCYSNPVMREFLVLADIHLDLNYDPNFGPDTFCKDPQLFDITDCQTDDVVLARRAFLQNDYGQLGCDVPPYTLSTAFESMKENLPNPDFIIVLGDMVAHCQQTMDDLLLSLEESSDYIRRTYPDTPVLPVIGNNDVFPHDSLAIGPSIMLNNLNEIWGSWIPLDQKETFLNGGYYASTPVVGLRVIALNTLYYFKKWCSDNSTIINPVCDNKKTDPATQFGWMASQLDTALFNDEKVYIIGHVGPGRSRGFDDNWKSQYQDKFYSTIYPYADIIEGIFFAHTHRDSFSLVNTKTEIMTKAIYFPSLTPRSNNNPAYRTVQYEEDTFVIRDMHTYTYDLELIRQYAELLPFWELEYVFSHVYSADVTEIVDLCSSLLVNNYLYNQFIKYFASASQVGYNQSKSHPNSKFYCMLTTFTNNDYDDCVESYKHTTS